MFFTVFLFLFSSVFADDKIECFYGLQLVAKFSNKSIVCDINQFLPANSVVCSNCPNGYTCSGGELLFNETKSSGIDYTQKITKSANNVCSENFPRMLYANFKIAERNCSPGYYLPANSVECTKCLNDHYCPGGNLTFNETTPQGIIECPGNHPFAPAGMWLSSQCGRKLHVGEDILYMHQSPAHPTVHRLFIGHHNGIYSANAVPRDMNSYTFPKMSEGMSKGLHVMIGDVEYLICDDSVPECRND